MKQYINDNGEIWDGKPITVGEYTYMAPSEDILALAGYHEYVAPEPTQEELLAMAKEDALMRIDDHDQSEAVNQFYLGGIPMWLDAPTRQQLRLSIEAYQATGAEDVTKWFNGEAFTFPVALWLQMLSALEVYASEALNVTEAHKAQVNAMTTIEDVEAFDVTAGYPPKLNLMPR